MSNGIQKTKLKLRIEIDKRTLEKSKEQNCRFKIKKKGQIIRKKQRIENFQFNSIYS